jgi:hypothetical protein
LAAGDDEVENAIRLSRALDYQPMFMTECHGLSFPWQEDSIARMSVDHFYF